MVKPYNCRACGETEPVEFYKGYKSVCKKCRSKQIIENTYDKEKERRKEIIKEKTYSCEPCKFATYSRQLLNAHYLTTKHGLNENVPTQTEIDRLESQLDHIKRRVRLVEV